MASLRADVLRSIGIGSMNNDPTGGIISSTSGISEGVQDAFMNDVISSGLQPVLEAGARYPFNSGTKGIHTIINKSNTKSGTSVTAGTGLVLYTVSTSKTFYVTGLSVTTNVANGIFFDIRDSSTPNGGTPIFNAGAGTVGTANLDSTTSVFTFSVPLKFAVAVGLDVNATGSIWWALQGWEE